MQRFFEILACLSMAVLFFSCGGDNAACDALKQDSTACLDAWCDAEGQDSPFCQCWENGQDMNTQNCECTSLNWGEVCSGIDDYEPGSLDCDAMTTHLGNIACD